MNIFHPPQTEYSDHYDLARFNLSWKINVFMSILLVLLGITFIGLGQIVYIPTFIGLLVTVSLLLIHWKTRRYQLASQFFAVTGTLLCQYTLLFFPEEFHFVDLFWIIIILLYTFFMLGRNWGLINTLVNTVGVIFYILFVLNTNLASVDSLVSGQIISLSINIGICGLIISFLLFQFLNVINIAENNLRQVNNALREQNAKVEDQHQEKTVMLREIHHRVKNNLQVITSLLRLQAQEIDDPHSKEKFNESINRVISMALIHERMYQSEHLARIDLEGYLTSLSEELIQSYNVKKPIELAIQCEIDHITPKSLVSIALIFNELISNSIKHAFEHTAKAKIDIKLLIKSDDTVNLVYHDNGTWKDRERPNSFGIDLIESLCDQLNGAMNVETTAGTRYEFNFERQYLIQED